MLILVKNLFWKCLASLSVCRCYESDEFDIACCWIIILICIPNLVEFQHNDVKLLVTLTNHEFSFFPPQSCKGMLVRYRTNKCLSNISPANHNYHLKYIFRTRPIWEEKEKHNTLLPLIRKFSWQIKKNVKNSK